MLQLPLVQRATPCNETSSMRDDRAMRSFLVVEVVEVVVALQRLWLLGLDSWVARKWGN
jgi:hypothetical protein